MHCVVWNVRAVLKISVTGCVCVWYVNLIYGSTCVHNNDLSMCVCVCVCVCARTCNCCLPDDMLCDSKCLNRFCGTAPSLQLELTLKRTNVPKCIHGPTCV